MMQQYARGWGRVDPPVECQERPQQVDCPCCEGAGEHEWGAGMDADGGPCYVCDTYGYLLVSVPKAVKANV